MISVRLDKPVMVDALETLKRELAAPLVTCDDKVALFDGPPHVIQGQAISRMCNRLGTMIELNLHNPGDRVKMNFDYHAEYVVVGEKWIRLN